MSGDEQEEDVKIATCAAAALACAVKINDRNNNKSPNWQSKDETVALTRMERELMQIYYKI